MRDKKRCVLITGVSGGIGTAATMAFAEAGWQVIGVDVRAIGEPMQYLDRYIQTDVSNPQEIQALFSQLLDNRLPLHALINNAAVQICRPLVNTTVQEWDLTMNSNVRSAFLCSTSAYPLLKRGNGAIVNVCSVHALATSSFIGAYAASKGALLSLTRSMAIEFAGAKIRVNAVLPGAIDTEMLRQGLARGGCLSMHESKLMQKLAKKHLFGRVGMPEEIAQALLFLADNDRSSFITGQTLIVDGGAMARLSTE